jgi:predicted TIM-barrel fold metal-dependent hydrolase
MTYLKTGGAQGYLRIATEEAFITKEVLAAIAPQDPAWSAKEIERGHKLGFKAVIHNGHVAGEYTDDPKYWPIFEAAEALGTPVYLHPQGPSKGLIGPLLEQFTRGYRAPPADVVA